MTADAPPPNNDQIGGCCIVRNVCVNTCGSNELIKFDRSIELNQCNVIPFCDRVVQWMTNDTLCGRRVSFKYVMFINRV